MSASGPGPGNPPDSHPDRLRWNARYAGQFVPSFRPHPLAVRALALDLPDGPVADLACGASGSALLAASSGRHVTAVDISEVALALLGSQARREGLDRLITLEHADLAGWHPQPRSLALVLCTGFWLAEVFAAAAAAVADGGLIGWEALTAGARRSRPDLPAEWCLAPGEPASLLPDGFAVLDQRDVPAERRQLLARRDTSRLSFRDAETTAVDFRPAVDYRDRNTGNPPQNRNQPRKWDRRD